MTKTKYDFDTPVDRRGTGATLYEEMEMKFGRTDLTPLWIADMGFAVCPEITEALRRRLDNPVFGYTTPTADFWDSIMGWMKRRHGLSLRREELDFVPGVKKGIGLMINYFTKPGDKILIQPPVYHSFHSLISGNNRVAVHNPLVRRGDDYLMDLEALEETCRRERPVMMLFCNPHNPVGMQWGLDIVRAVAKICQRYGIILISDEIYGDMMLTDKPHIPTLCSCPEAEEVTITIGAPSKTFNIPGFAAAWVAIRNPKLRDGFFKWLLTSEFNTPPMEAIIAAQAAYTYAEDWLDQLLPYLRDNALHAVERLNAMEGVHAIMPESGFCVWTDFAGLGLTHAQVMDLMADGAGLAVSSGVTFGDGGEGFIRLNTGVARCELDAALDCIERAVNNFHHNKKK